MKCSQFDAMCRLKGNCFQRLKALKDVGPKFTVVNFLENFSLYFAVMTKKITS